MTAYYPHINSVSLWVSVQLINFLSPACLRTLSTHEGRPKQRNCRLHSQARIGRGSGHIWRNTNELYEADSLSDLEVFLSQF